MNETYSEAISNSPYKKVYWFARYLIDTDQYGAIGSKKTEPLMRVVVQIERLLDQPFNSAEDTYFVAKELLLDGIRCLAKEGTKTGLCTENLAATLGDEIAGLADVRSFCIAMRHIVLPINQALSRVPASDKEFVLTGAEKLLGLKGETGTAELIAWWDKAGVKYCVDAERLEVVCAFANLMLTLKANNDNRSQIDDYLIMTAFVQEFERRLGQKRKARGGTSLEDVVGFIFNTFDLPSAGKPKHFDQDIEVDKWFKCSDGWVIGISCKRTLRERWKQLSQADRGTLSHFKIKEIWHIITYDKDLSDDKITRLGEQNHVIYLSDKSEVYKRCKDHIGMSSYVRPLSSLVSDIRMNMGWVTKSHKDQALSDSAPTR